MRALCRRVPKPKRPPDFAQEWKAATKPLDEEGIAELARLAEATVDDERARGRQLDGKTAQLAGFSGLILTIDTAFAESVFADGLGSVGTPLARVAFFASVFALLSAVAMAIGGVLMPQKHGGMSRKEVFGFRGPKAQSMSLVEVQRSMLGTFSLILAQDRYINDCKAHITKRVAFFLLVGFIALSAQGLTLGVHRLGIQ